MTKQLSGLLRREFRFLHKPLNVWSRLLLLAAAVTIGASLFFPLWKMHLVAPQYPDGLDLYIAPESASYLDGATIDYVFRLIGSELKVLAPLRKLDTPDGRMAAKIEQVLTEQVNPSLAMHGGAAALIDVMNGIAFLELTGGCQGCSMADATLKNGIERAIREFSCSSEAWTSRVAQCRFRRVS